MPRTTRAAVIRSSPGRWEVVEVELDDPRQGEVTVRLAASGLCHSEDHLATGDRQAATYPMAGGHEGAGVVTAVGPATPGFAAGDHVVFSFVPSCGRCSACARGRFALCHRGGRLMLGTREDDSHRMHLDGQGVGQFCGIATFAEHTTVAVDSLVPIEPDIPLVPAALVGCGVPTGWGSAVHSAGVGPGDTVVVLGVGGIGVNALQGARHAGASTVVAVDPEPYKQQRAPEFGATHVFGDIGEATRFVQSRTQGQGADSCIVAIGVVQGADVAAALACVAKGGTVVLTGLGPAADRHVPLSLADLTLLQKRLQGSLFGGCSPQADIPRLLSLYRGGRLLLDELVTRTYRLDQVNEAYADLRAGQTIRGVLVFD